MTGPVEVNHHSVWTGTVGARSDGLGWRHRGCSWQASQADQDGSSKSDPCSPQGRLEEEAGSDLVEEVEEVLGLLARTHPRSCIDATNHASLHSGEPSSGEFLLHSCIWGT